jgi:hypothetical protein
MLRLSEPPGPGADRAHTRPASQRCEISAEFIGTPDAPSPRLLTAPTGSEVVGRFCSASGAPSGDVPARAGLGLAGRAPHLGHRVSPGGAAQQHRPAGLRGDCADRLLRVELDVLGDADRLAEAGPRAVGEGPPWYPRSGPAGFGRGRARQAPPLCTLTGAANGRLRPASWPPVDMVLATEGLEFRMGQRGHIAAGQRRMARRQRPSRRLPLPAMGNGRARPASC